MLHRFGKKTDDRFDWGDALCDAAIMGGLTFFTTLGGLAITDLLRSPVGWVAAGIAAASQFFLVLALKRGLVKKGD